MSQLSAAMGQAHAMEQPSVVVTHPQLYSHAEQRYQVSRTHYLSLTAKVDATSSLLHVKHSMLGEWHGVRLAFNTRRLLKRRRR